jgi:hypothetical protein
MEGRMSYYFWLGALADPFFDERTMRAVRLVKSGLISINDARKAI